MDRGFTVKGLSVTYMPRPVGTGNADTLQQRARFFGYKRNFLGLCRIYLETRVLNAFEAYVEHEEQMRKELLSLSESGRPLSDWKRRFILAPDLKPCRINVIQHDYVRGNFADQWVVPRSASMPAEVAQWNAEVVSRFLKQLTFQPDTAYKTKQVAQQHEVCTDIPLEVLVTELLLPYRVVGADDGARMIGLQLQLERALEANAGERAALYRMRPRFNAKRTVKGDDWGGSFMQGPTNAPGKNGYTYPGDGFFKVGGQVNFQIHTFDLRNEKQVITAKGVPFLAIWVPKRLRLNWVAQDQQS